MARTDGRDLAAFAGIDGETDSTNRPKDGPNRNREKEQVRLTRVGRYWPPCEVPQRLDRLTGDRGNGQEPKDEGHRGCPRGGASFDTDGEPLLLDRQELLRGGSKCRDAEFVQIPSDEVADVTRSTGRVERGFERDEFSLLIQRPIDLVCVPSG